ncbi:metallophosphoesterase family protein [Candidatus Gracilibacteria bacterium]|nr:metallophosphoesterase family protein [Candidatus Gracilibacteria bacterium]
MKWGIVSDSHGAVDRLAIVFDTLQKKGIDHVIHAGDFLNEGAIEVFRLFQI